VVRQNIPNVIFLPSQSRNNLYTNVVHNCFKMRFNNLIFLAILFVFSSCEQAERLNTDIELEEKIKESVTSGQTTLDLGKLAAFDWDSLLILTPYVDPDKLEEEFGINLSRTKHSMIQSRDDINQLIFFDNRKPVDMVEYPRYPGDFSKNKVQFIERDSSIFDIIVTTRKTDEGDYWIELKLR
jgi:hypothetical protein